MISIHIEKKLRAYQGQRVLKVIGAFEQGSITKIYGPSGAGKTTLLKMIAGLITPDAGSIVVNGDTWFDASSNKNVAPQQRRAGFVFQDYALFPNMNILQHLQYATGDAEWIDRLLHMGKLETLITHKPQHLSGGQQQRLAILRALAVKPRVLLMDEPFSALDPEMKQGLISGLKQIFTELGTTVFIVTHNPVELEGLVDGELLIT